MGITIYAYENPDGEERFAAQVSYNDTFLCHDMTRAGITEWWGERAKREAIRDLEELEWPIFDRNDRNDRFIKRDMKGLKSDLKLHFKLGHCKDEKYNESLRKLLEQLS